MTVSPVGNPLASLQARAASPQAQQVAVPAAAKDSDGDSDGSGANEAKPAPKVGQTVGSLIDVTA
jgi:hypothetical protein